MPNICSKSQYAKNQVGWQKIPKNNFNNLMKNFDIVINIDYTEHDFLITENIFLSNKLPESRYDA